MTNTSFLIAFLYICLMVSNASIRKVAVVTGSSKGIGKAIAWAFAKSGDYSGVVINSRDLEEAKRVSKEINDSFTDNCDSIAIAGDVSKEEDCIQLIADTIKKYKRIDVLVNNAGIQKDLPLTDITLADWHRVLDVNITGPFVCSREAVKHMRKQQAPNGGCIINISSVHQMIPKPHYLPYSTSKAGIEMMTKTLALELAKDGIRVNVVAPGAIETDLNIDLQTDKNELENVLKRVPTGRIGKPEEVANAVEFIASDKASYVTGSSFVVDGGMTLYPSFGIGSEHDLAKHA